MLSISDSEALVMDVLWEHGPSTADDIIERVAAANNWSAVTVRTLLNRLLKKSAVKATREGRRYIYSPVAERETYLSEKSTNLIDKLFGGRLAPFVSHFAEHRSLTDEDREALQALLADLDQRSDD